MTDKEIDRIIKANIKMAGFISLVRRMREAQKQWKDGDPFDGTEMELAKRMCEAEREVDELLKKMEGGKVMELLQKIKDIYEDADKNWNHGYNLLKYLDENNDLQESRTDYSTVISYAMDAVRMLDDIKSIIEKEERK